MAPGKMRVANLSKATAVTIDCDFCDFPALLAMYGLEPSEESRKVVKGSLYALSEMEVRSMMDGMGFIPQAINGLCALGFPVAPNRVLYTGHGVNLIYWLPESIGWNDDSEWNLKRVKSIFSRLVEQHTPWFIDPSAKDVGTRIFPIPGHPHRRESAYKTIAVLDGGHDTVSDWDAILTTLDATLKKVKGARRSKTSKSKGKPTGEKVNWTYTRWNDALNYMRDGYHDYPSELAREHLLVIDDVGAEHGSEYGTQKLLEVLEKRLGKWTFITSNLGMEAFAEMDKRIASRLIRNHNKVLEIQSKDFALR